MFHNTALIKQWSAKWDYIANAVFQIVQNQAVLATKIKNKRMP